MQLSSDPTTRQAQLTAIKNHVNTNYVVGGGGAFNQETADAMNLQASPDWTVWKTSITKTEVDETVDWSEVVDLTTNSLLSFSLLKDSESLNPSVQSVRAAFNDIFPAVQNPNTNAGLTALAKRLATEAEQVLSSGTGSDASPATMGDGAEGDITEDNLIEAARDG